MGPPWTTSTLETLQTLGSKYSFNKFPRKFEEIDLSKGIELIDGRFEGTVIDKLTIFTNGVVIDTRSSTESSEKVLDSLMALIHQAFGARFTPARHTFISQIVFRSQMRMTFLHPLLQVIADRLTERVSEDMKHPFTFEPTAILLNTDTSQIKIAPGMFTIERLADAPFKENMYFSSAPLRTSEHIELVERFESSITQATSTT